MIPSAIVERIVRRVLCESDSRWPRLNQQQQESWLANAHGDARRFALAMAIANAVLAEYHAALAETGMAVLPLEATDEMQRAGWIDKEDVNPDEIWRAMARAALAGNRAALTAIP